MIQQFKKIKYIIHKPKKIQKKHPLLIMIHGYGSNEKNLFFLFKKYIPSNFFIISLRGLYEIHNNNHQGYHWYNINTKKSTKIEIDHNQMIKSKKQIIKFIKNIFIKYHNIDENKIWLCGFSQGAFLSNIIGLNKKYNIKYVISISGFILSNYIKNIIYNKETKFLITHGVYDKTISINIIKKFTSFLKKNTIQYLFKTYKQNHEINQKNYYDIIKWMLKNNIRE